MSPSVHPLLASEYVVLDFETTGLSPARGAEVVEAGAVRVAGGEAVATFAELCRPSAPIPAGATAIHGISDAMVAEARPFGDVLPDLLAFLGEGVLVAHNAPFDRSFLDAAMLRAGHPPLANAVLDTVRLSRRLFPDLERHDLGTLCTVHRIDRSRGHRALDDAVATATLLRILLDRAAETGVASPDELRALGAAGRRRGVPPAPEEAMRLDAGGQARLEEAMVTGDRVVLRYLSAKGNGSRRIVVPYRLDAEGAAPRLLAYDLDAGVTRSFRLERVVAVEPEENAP